MRGVKSNSVLGREAPDLAADHDPGVTELHDALVSAAPVEPIEVSDGHVIRIGTASWTDPTMTAPGVFYPPGAKTAEARLRYYASRFPLVEVDSTYYALPVMKTAELWRDRTPDGFVFNVKAHALMTGQPSEVSRLPRILQDALPSDLVNRSRIYAKDLSPELTDVIWGAFLDAIEPLRQSGKLGAILLQYPRWFIPSKTSAAIIRDAVARLEGVPFAVELRNHRWFSNDERGTDRTMAWFASQQIPLVMVDGPQGLESSVPPLAASTSPSLAVVRLHGRRTATWEAADVPTVERYRYYYTKDELAEWVPKIVSAALKVKETHVLLNNCYGNYGAANAVQLASAIREQL